MMGTRRHGCRLHLGRGSGGQGRARPRRGRVAALVAALGPVLSLACATIEAPPGGPVDTTPPRLAAARPESGAVGLGEVRELRLTFSEKVEPQDAWRFVKIYPPCEVVATRWEGRRVARLLLAEPLPADTVIVVEIAPGVVDNHRVTSDRPFIYPLATAGSLPTGEISGSLRLGDKPLAPAVVELYAVAPETVRSFTQQPPLRRAWTDSAGVFRLPWLAAPGGPWLLRAFADPNRDGRPAENDAQLVLPDTLRLTVARPRLRLPPLTLFTATTPGNLAGVIDSTPPWTGPLVGWVERIAEGDTGWIPTPQQRAPAGRRPVPRGERVVWPRVGPGLVRLLLVVDLNGDSLLTLVPDTALGGWRLEPHALVDSVTVEPGLEAGFPPPVFPDTLIRWLGPVPASAQDTTAARADTSAATPSAPAAAVSDSVRER